ncbi:major facilitator superfamily domain-containing protein [Rhodocollybia butyracea]|uniref:Major facilitator superfamily domain-containing protein n=1 Tax=Rhodocollybia butyracea TaxID=206335 RepID=A0A9P5P0J0_9AGAR|nr:major facilitator superfamily domain-containing protein [Rhodocollybia butyracea]
MDAVELKKLERQAVKRMDIVILPMITMFYLLSFLDRSNIGNARVAGLQKDLGMTDSQYSICITILYVPYICAELPANLLLRKIGPRFLMPSLLTLWGLMVALQGLVTSFAGLVVVRAFLGLVEGPMFPGIVLYLSSFYTRDELAFRVAIFFSSASLSGGIFWIACCSYHQYGWLAGRPGWAWIFILVRDTRRNFQLADGNFGILPHTSSPEELKFSTPAMRELLVRRLAKDKPSSSTNQDHFSFKEVFRDYPVWTGVVPSSIVGELGFNPDKTQLLSVGPFAGGFFVTLGIALWSDRMKSRSIATAVVICLSIAGFAIYLGSDNKFTRYGSLFLTVPGVYASVPPVAAWMSNNSVGSILIVVLSGVNALLLNYMNQQKVKRRDEILAPYNLDSDDEKGTNATRALVELGDRHPDFKYTL